MPVSDQNVESDRYAIIPRTLSFIIRDDELLLLRIASDRGAWSGRLNGVGGHIQRREDPLSSAKREVREETGLIPSDLRLCGVVIIDVHEPVGIGIYVFVGKSVTGTLQSSEEGDPIWVPIKSLDDFELVEDLPTIIPRALESYQTGEPFSATYYDDEAGQLSIIMLP